MGKRAGFVFYRPCLDMSGVCKSACHFAGLSYCSMVWKRCIDWALPGDLPFVFSFVMSHYLKWQLFRLNTKCRSKIHWNWQEDSCWYYQTMDQAICGWKNHNRSGLMTAQTGLMTAHYNTYAFLSSSILLICPPTNTRILHLPHRFLWLRRYRSRRVRPATGESTGIVTYVWILSMYLVF